MNKKEEILSRNMLTAEQLIQNKGIKYQTWKEWEESKKVLPKFGQKQFEPNNSWLENIQIEKGIKNCRDLLNIERVERISQLAVAEWLPDRRKAQVIKKSGQDWGNFGIEINKTLLLFPEEALLLLEMNCLELIWNGVALSIQQAYEILIDDTECTLEEYRVYSQLTRYGYHIQRFYYEDSIKDVISDESVSLKKKTIMKPKRGLRIEGSEQRVDHDTSNQLKVFDNAKGELNMLKINSNVQIDESTKILSNTFEEDIQNIIENIISTIECTNNSISLIPEYYNTKFKGNTTISYSANLRDNQSKLDSTHKEIINKDGNSKNDWNSNIEIIFEETLSNKIKEPTTCSTKNNTTVPKWLDSRIQRNVKLLPKRSEISLAINNKSECANVDKNNSLKRKDLLSCKNDLENKKSKLEVVELSDDEIQIVVPTLTRIEMLELLPNIASESVITQQISRNYIPHTIKLHKDIYQYETKRLRSLSEIDNKMRLKYSKQNLREKPHSSSTSSQLPNNRIPFYHQVYWHNRGPIIQESLHHNNSHAFMFGNSGHFRPFRNTIQQNRSINASLGNVRSEKNEYQSSFKVLPNVTSWKELKKKWYDEKTITIDDEDGTNNENTEGTEIEIVKEHIPPLIGSNNVSSFTEIYNKLRIIKNASEKIVRRKRSELKISYNVYSNTQHYRKANPGEPLYRLVVIRQKECPFFQPVELNRLQQDAKGTAIMFAVVSMSISLQVLGAGSGPGCTSLILITDHKRYLFNCGEGVQRLFAEYKIKLSKIEHIFITSAIWKNMGGLPGVVLTIAHLNEETKSLCHNFFKVTSPVGTKRMLQILKESNIVKNLTVTVDELTKDDAIKEYNDNLMTVSCVLIYPNVDNKYEHISETITDNDTDDTDTSHINKKRKNNESRSEKRIRSSEKDIVPVLSYICKLNDKIGSLCLDKCLAKGLKPGPILGLLKNGKDVTLDDGTVVKHEEVCLPKQKGPVFLVVECPSEEYVESFVNQTAFEKYQEQSSNDDKPYCIIHFTPQKIMDNTKYKEWMNKFDSNTYHLVINENNTCLGSQAVFKQQYMLNVLHPKIFPYLQSNCFQNKLNVECQDANTEKENTPGIYYAKSLQTIELRPTQKFDSNSKISIDKKAYINELNEINDFPKILAELHSNIDKQTKTMLAVEEYPKFVMLGTGSSIPSKVRNTSAILVRTDEDTSILLDCSEGTLSQMGRVYGITKLNDILASIKAVYISHMHADHHLGLIGVLLAKAKVTKDPTFLLIPDTLGSWLNYCYEYYKPIKDYITLISNHDLLDFKPNTIEISSLKKNLSNKLNVMEINTTIVRHCNLSYGISLVFKNNKKVVYSGDTMPCNSLIQLGMNCDLLIHEATLQDELSKEAIFKKHSTMSEAIQMGERMKSHFTLLTHFSQRHTKLPIIPENTNLDLSKVGIAYDYMHFNFSQLKFLPLLYPCLKTIFHNYMILTEERMIKKLQSKIKYQNE
ncbi:uncharacterized protein LOC124954496 [Vespa velutina]|uniref:uncharacterized protein LOC124954496 n=1 Tax=Vespa velutina TaxID=202808 RepID=UPI001FB4D739|nr:uncharacterized protein LOC124954496 [Vespa velutina]